jgi:predicted  nucleic acid-binding Zn-ribbon protein
MSNAGGDKGLGTNLNAVGREFGITSNNDQVSDDEHNYGIRTLPISQNFELHPMTTDIELLLLPGACSLIISESTIPIVKSGNKAEPPNAPVIAVAEKGLGKFIFFGSYELFRDNIRGGIQVIQHRNLLKNMINWISENIEERRTILNIESVFNALSFNLKKKKKQKKGTEPIKVISSAPVIKTPDGKISPESMLDQIITSLRKLQEIGGNLNIIDNNLTRYAHEIQLLRNEIKPIPKEIKPLQKKLTTISKLLEDLNDEIQSIKISDSLNKAVQSLDDFKSNFESQIDIILTKNLNPIKMEFSEITETLMNNKKEFTNLNEKMDSIKNDLLTKEDLADLKESIMKEIKNELEDQNTTSD